MGPMGPRNIHDIMAFNLCMARSTLPATRKAALQMSFMSDIVESSYTFIIE